MYKGKHSKENIITRLATYKVKIRRSKLNSKKQFQYSTWFVWEKIRNDEKRTYKIRRSKWNSKKQSRIQSNDSFGKKILNVEKGTFKEFRYVSDRTRGC